MTQESDDPDDVFMGEIPYDVIYDDKIRVFTRKLQETTEELNRYLKKTEYWETNTTKLFNYRNIITIYTNLIQLAKLALIDKVIGNDTYVENTFALREELEKDDCDYEQLAKDITSRLNIIKCKYEVIISNYYRAKHQEEQKTK